MNVSLNLANQLSVKLSQDFPRVQVKPGKQVGVEPIVTNSIKISWQLQCLKMHEQVVVTAAEAYSRYIIFLPYPVLPQWEKIHEDFMGAWLDHVFYWLTELHYLLDESSMAELARQFEALVDGGVFRNTDLSVIGHINEAQQWLNDVVDNPFAFFDDIQATELSHHINQQLRHGKSASGFRESYVPIERFVNDSLYRFAQGLSEISYSGVAPGNFPNPHQRKVRLSVVQ